MKGFGVETGGSNAGLLFFGFWAYPPILTSFGSSFFGGTVLPTPTLPDFFKLTFFGYKLFFEVVDGTINGGRCEIWGWDWGLGWGFFFDPAIELYILV